MKFSTESGSEYEILGNRVRRTNLSAAKRADGEWVEMADEPYIQEGHRATLILKSLAPLGPDDIGTPPEWAGEVTTRTTSTVTKVWF